MHSEKPNDEQTIDASFAYHLINALARNLAVSDPWLWAQLPESRRTPRIRFRGPRQESYAWITRPELTAVWKSTPMQTLMIDLSSAKSDPSVLPSHQALKTTGARGHSYSY
jgi:hypothetical protein